MKRILLIVIAALFVLSTMAQNASRKDIDKHPHLAVISLSTYGGPYFFEPIAKAPKGYKPFYISHYGRHGSRHESRESYITELTKIFDKADEMNLLTAKGKELKAHIYKMGAAHKHL